MRRGGLAEQGHPCAFVASCLRARHSVGPVIVRDIPAVPSPPPHTALLTGSHLTLRAIANCSLLIANSHEKGGEVALSPSRCLQKILLRHLTLQRKPRHTKREQRQARRLRKNYIAYACRFPRSEIAQIVLRIGGLSPL